MTHLAPAELVELVEGTLPAERAAHADACERCARRVADVRGVLAEVRRLEVPEPPPSFWAEFSARVRERVAAEAGWHEPSRWFLRPAAVAAAGLALSVVLAVAVGWRAKGGAERSPDVVPERMEPARRAAPGGEPFIAATTEEGWEVLSSLLADLGWDDAQDAAAFSVRPGAAEQALAMLDEAERAELLQLLQREVSGSVR